MTEKYNVLKLLEMLSKQNEEEIKVLESRKADVEKMDTLNVNNVLNVMGAI